MSIAQTLARLLGVRHDQLEDALKDERRAKRQLSRRGLLMAGVALAAGNFVGVERTYSFAIPPRSWTGWEGTGSGYIGALVLGPLMILSANEFWSHERQKWVDPRQGISR